MIGKEVTVWTASSDVSPLVLAPSRRSSTTGVGLVSGTLHLLTTGRRSLGQLISMQDLRCSVGLVPRVIGPRLWFLTPNQLDVLRIAKITVSRECFYLGRS